MEEKETPVLKPDVEARHSAPSPLNETKLKSEENVESEPPIIKPNGKKVRTRKIYKRNIFLQILFSIVTVVYELFWIFEIDKESKAITKQKRGAAPSLVVFLTIITFGIYNIYWVYSIGKKQSSFYLSSGIKKQKLGVLYLVILLIGWILALALSLCMFFVTGGDIGAATIFATLLFTIFGLLFFYVSSFLVLGLMQHHNNRLIELSFNQGRKEIICRDSSLFNRPFWSTVFLLIIGTNFMTVLSDPVKKLLENEIPKMPTNTNDAIQQLIQQSAREVANAGDINQIIVGLVTIITSVLILWWFALRFKHSNYKGVLTTKKFGKALLLCLPAFVVVGFNCFGYFMGEVPEFQRGVMWVIGVIVLGFIPGFIEEVGFRGMIVPNLIRIYNRKAGIWIALFVSAGIFGLIHMANVLAGADMGTTCFQVFYAFALGVTFAAVLLRTGNLWASIICHGLVDTAAFLAPAALEQGGVQTQAFTLDIGTILLIVWSVVMIIYGIWLVRPKKHDEILALWREKFGDAMLEPIK
ncbi:MAG: CPBP family glutamic-type intramembrane protease [Coriobacteriia bacterium]|nr:CPBP family glutamic-type intramembrane protease [Coriobacteriia bacterium]